MKLSSCFVCLGLIFSLGCPPILGQELPPLRWGTDPTGGAPYVYQDSDGNTVGFEVDLAEYLAEKLKRKSVMVSGDWSNLLNQLDKPSTVEKGLDIVLNGYELRKDLLTDYAATRPYYVYRLVMVAEREQANKLNLRGWADLYPNPKEPIKTVCVLGGSVAHRYVKSEFDKGVSLLTNNDVANVFKLVEDRRLDATVQDNPASTFFLKNSKKLVQVGEAVQASFYVMYYRKTDPELGEQINQAIAEGLRDGTLKNIYQKYNLWNSDQERLWYWLEQPWPPANLADAIDVDEENEATNPWPRLIPQLLEAAGMTILLSIISFPLAMLIGLLLALGRVYGPSWLSIPCNVYVEVVRGTPLLLQLFMIYYLLPELLLKTDNSVLVWMAENLTPMMAGIIGLAINYSAYEAENYRAGLLAIPKGQMEAALALGLSPYRAVRRIIIPQALRLVIPPVTNDFIALFKDTSACSIVLVVELTRKYNELFNFNRGLIVELAFLTAGLYLLMSYPLALFAQRLERKYPKPGSL